ncbi:MAG: DNA-binding response regulator [Burkholderiales bacterium RIFCSPLOWO2_12_FULL_64_99]|nr:MAG: DNA-binding response regulator [Burkholderiales bacterium RIFCSPHIGHO2_12_FULL_63_20]OGB64576.1 MAG: DNA-binding response regulator [Burkholderiales bacterium RIFCSPLOWO2_12_FULL_64_99]
MIPLVHIVDDDADFRDGLAWLLDSRGLRTRCWAGGDLFLADLRPDSDTWACSIMLLDIRMAPLSGLATFEQLKAQGWPWPVLFLTGHGDLSMAVAAVKNGAWDFLEKPFQDNQLVDKVEAACREAVVLQTESQAKLRFQQALAALSQREREVLDELLQGHYNKNIADHLGITPRTVEFHRANIFEKLQVQSAVELAHLMGRYASAAPGLNSPRPGGAATP